MSNYQDGEASQSSYDQDEISRLRKEKSQLIAALNSTNKLIFGKINNLDSETYFAIRQIVCKAIKDSGGIIGNIND